MPSLSKNEEAYNMRATHNKQKQIIMKKILIYFVTIVTVTANLSILGSCKKTNGKMICLGDSITYGYIPHGLAGNPYGQLDSYAQIAADILDLSLTNYGVSGNKLIGLDNLETAMCNRYINMIDDADVVTFMGGTNDIRVGVHLGTMKDRVVDGDSSTYTYYAGCHKLVEGLYKKYINNSGKKIKLIGITPPKMLLSPAAYVNGTGTLYPNQELWVNAFIEVCEYYDIPVCDFYHSGLLETNIACDYRNTAYGHTGYFNPLIPDGIHPSAIGHHYLGTFLADYISRL